MSVKFLSIALIFLFCFSLSEAMDVSQREIDFIKQCFELKISTPNEILLRGIQGQKVALVKLALAYGADVNYNKIDRIDDDYTALHIAMDRRNLDIISLLLDSGADIVIKARGDDTIKFAEELVKTYYGSKLQPSYKKVLELLQDWQKKLNEKVKKEVGPHLPSVLADIVVGYVV